jgi:DNA-binding CsgD family transcriptional regulator/N-acetylneuraminic acid mutarotase
MAEYGEALSERELDVLRCLAGGAGNKEIAQELSISQNTVKVHLRNIFVKLGASSRTEATTIGLQQGLLTLPGMDTAVAPTPPPIAPEPTELEPIIQESAAEPTLSEVPLLESAPARTHWRTSTVILALLLVVVGVVAITAVWQAQTNASATTTPAAYTPEELGENWLALRPMPEPRFGSPTTAFGLNVYLLGGNTEAGPTDVVMVYDTNTHQWQEAAAKPTAVSRTSAAELFGEIYVPGGQMSDGQPTAVVEAYSPVNNSWRTVQALPHPVAGGLTLSDGRFLYLFGGYDGESVLDTAYVYDPAANSWRPLPPMPTARVDMAGGILAGDLYAVGGFDGQTAVASCTYFSPPQEVWQSCPNMLAARQLAGGAGVVNKLYIFGGQDGETAVTFSEYYDPASRTWHLVNTPMLNEQTTWSDFGLALIGTQLYTFGGKLNGAPIAAAYEYIPLVYTTFIPAASSNSGE